MQEIQYVGKALVASYFYVGGNGLLVIKVAKKFITFQLRGKVTLSEAKKVMFVIQLL